MVFCLLCYPWTYSDPLLRCGWFGWCDFDLPLVFSTYVLLSTSYVRSLETSVLGLGHDALKSVKMSSGIFTDMLIEAMNGS